tara:strand:- start:5583 stop:6161 length:579 start_codon:yes stop_codon:yes gene_type:complete
MVNNIVKIKGLLRFYSEDDFYHLQILKRKKENPELGRNSMCIKTYYIKSLENLEFHMPEIICLCDFHNARGCINLNKRSFEKASFHTLRKVTDQIMNKDYKSTRNAYNSVCGSVGNPNKGEKKWIIDVDIKGEEGRAEMIRLIQNLPPNVFVAELETKNGWHLITYPFNLQEYKEVVPHDIQKDNPTILYIS